MSTSGAKRSSETSEQRRITERVNFISEHRSVIDQAKGMIMFLNGIGADDAFEMLRAQSQQHNVKLHLLAEQLIVDLLELSRSKESLDRLDAHQALITVHERAVEAPAAEQLDGQPKTQC